MKKQSNLWVLCFFISIFSCYNFCCFSWLLY